MCEEWGLRGGELAWRRWCIKRGCRELWLFSRQEFWAFGDRIYILPPSFFAVPWSFEIAEDMVCEAPFGTFEGVAGDGVVQYRGIQYARLKDQLATPELVTSYGANTMNATAFGYVGLLTVFISDPL